MDWKKWKSLAPDAESKVKIQHLKYNHLIFKAAILSHMMIKSYLDSVRNLIMVQNGKFSFMIISVLAYLIIISGFLANEI